MHGRSLPTFLDSLDAVRAAQLAIGLGVTILIAEWFYKFHSFTLEFVAALATWLITDRALRVLTALIGPRDSGG